MAQTGKTSFGTKKRCLCCMCTNAHTTFLFIQSNRTQTKRGLRRRNDDIYKQWGNELAFIFLRRPTKDDPSKRYYCDINPNIYMSTNLISS